MQTAFLLSAESGNAEKDRNETKADEGNPATFLTLQKKPRLPLVLSRHLGHLVL